MYDSGSPKSTPSTVYDSGQQHSICMSKLPLSFSLKLAFCFAAFTVDHIFISDIGNKWSPELPWNIWIRHIYTILLQYH